MTATGQSTKEYLQRTVCPDAGLSLAGELREQLCVGCGCGPKEGGRIMSGSSTTQDQSKKGETVQEVGRSGSRLWSEWQATTNIMGNALCVSQRGFSSGSDHTANLSTEKRGQFPPPYTSLTASLPAPALSDIDFSRLLHWLLRATHMLT